MKQFLIKTSLFLFLPAGIWMLMEVLLPVTAFTHRHFEAVSYSARSNSIKPMYPNVNSFMYAVGDMCHHTPYAILKKEAWKTDKLGYRNDEFVEEADVMFIGDSYFQGSGLSQDEIISNRVKAMFNNKIKVYNLSPTSLSQFEILFKTGQIKKPKVIIYSIVERNLPQPMFLYVPKNEMSLKERFEKRMEESNLNVYVDKVLKMNSIKWLRARIHESKGYGTPGINNSNMFFFKGINQEYNPGNIAPTVNTLLSYKKYCDSLGIAFMFIPMPNKETVYYDLVPFEKQPEYLFKLDSMLHVAGINTINTLKIYNEYRKTNKELLYHLDDTHWNPNATKLIAGEIAKELRSGPKYQLHVNNYETQGN